MAALPSPPPVWPSDPDQRRRAQARYRAHLQSIIRHQRSAQMNTGYAALGLAFAFVIIGIVMLAEWGK